MSKVCTYICLAFIPVLAQEQLTPPRTHIVLPSDTSHTASRVAQKLEADSSQIELPDVVVMGQNSSLRQVDQKKGGRNEQPRLLQPQEAYQPLSSWLRRSQERQSTDESPFKNQMSWFVLQAGSYTTLQTQLGHWRRLSNGLFHGHGWFDQSNGEFNNSQFRQGGLAGKLEYQLTVAAKGQMQFQYERFSRGLHGAGFRDTKRTGGRGGLDLSLSLDPRPLTNIRFNVEVKGLSLNSDTTHSRLDESGDFYYNMALSVQQVWSKLQLSLQGRYMREAYNSFNETTSMVASFREANLEALYPLSQQVQFSGGLGVQGMSADSGIDKTILAPFARVRYSPSDRFAIALQGKSGLHYQPYTQRWQENPYLSHRFFMQPEESRFSLRLESEIALAKSSHLQLVVGKNWLDRLLFWQRETSTGLFELGTGSGSLSEIHLRFNSNLTKKSQISLSAAGFTDQLDEANAYRQQDHVPYRPDWQFGIQGRQFIATDWTLSATVEYWSKRASRMNTDQRLPDFALVRTSVQKSFGRYITAWLSLQNIADSQYVWWENYSEPGFTVTTGIRAQL